MKITEDKGGVGQQPDQIKIHRVRALGLLNDVLDFRADHWDNTKQDHD